MRRDRIRHGNHVWHLALRKGYKHARECLKQELPDLQTSTLYSYAFVAKHFDQEHTRKWGVSKLQRLIALLATGFSRCSDREEVFSESN